jgi:dUTP pyrophosphatase
MTISDFVAEKLHDDVELPTLADDGAAAFDARAYLTGRTVKFWTPDNNPYEMTPSNDPVTGTVLSIPPHHRALIPLGFKARIPEGFCVLVFTRSGQALKQGIMLGNGVGVIDESYPGEWGAILLNSSNSYFEVQHGARVCQLMPIETHARTFNWTEGVVGQTTQRTGGFGSSGTK